MKITMIGHATLLIETKDIRVLTDPVLQDPHQEGMLEIFPRRTLTQIPEFDLLYLSHRHQDHFDLDTLAQLPRDIQVLLPDDPLLMDAFQRLGYQHISKVHDFLNFKIEGTEFLITPSRVDFPEHGLVVRTDDGVFWNQVDTILDASVIREVLEKVGHPDLFLASWQPMIEMGWQHGEGVSFPHSAYAALLDNIRRVAPRALAPGANGFRYAGDAAWMNQIVFPQSRERFLGDIARLIPGIQDALFGFDPGDVLELSAGKAIWRPQAASFVSSEPRDPAVLEFCPPAAQRPLTDPLGESGDEAREEIRVFLEEQLSATLQANPATFTDHSTWEVIYQLEVRFGEESLHWHIDFTQEPLAVKPGREPQANFFCGITAAGLAGLMRGTASWDRASIGGGFYHYHRLYGVWERGLILPSLLSTPNPLTLLFPEDTVFAAMLEHRLEQLGAQRGELHNQI